MIPQYWLQVLCDIAMTSWKCTELVDLTFTFGTDMDTEEGVTLV